MGGTLFVAWGYVEDLGVVTHVLSFVVPTLFLAAIVGLCVLRRRRLGVLGWIGMTLAAYGLGWGVVPGILWSGAVWAYFEQSGWPHLLSDWLLFALTGLILMGTATVRSSGPLRGTGAVALATGAFGWIYDLTDTGAVLEVRSVHVGSGLLFGLGWVALGGALLAARARLSRRPQARG